MLLEEALKHTDTGRYLFAFLRHQPNDTARGYFSELLHFTDNNFQDKVRERAISVTVIPNYGQGESTPVPLLLLLP